MVQTKESIRDAAMLLSSEEREELVGALLESLDNPDSDLDDQELKAELERRAEEAKRDPSSLATWEEVRGMR